MIEPDKIDQIVEFTLEIRSEMVVRETYKGLEEPKIADTGFPLRIGTFLEE